MLTPRSRHIGKSIARGSKKTMISECFKDHIARSHILNTLGLVIRHEFKAMCSGSTDSILKNLDTNDLKMFTGQSSE